MKMYIFRGKHWCIPEQPKIKVLQKEYEFVYKQFWGKLGVSRVNIKEEKEVNDDPMIVIEFRNQFYHLPPISKCLQPEPVSYRRGPRSCDPVISPIVASPLQHNSRDSTQVQGRHTHRGNKH